VRICVLGMWHLGSVTAACLASVGHEVIGFDPDIKTITSLKNGKAALFEPELDALILKGIKSGFLDFTNNLKNACRDIEVLWVTFDTPIDEEDVADSEYVIDQVIASIQHLPDGSLILISSQLPVGSIAVLEELTKRIYPGKLISFAYSPENLRLGNAINVFLRPDRIIVGTRTNTDRKILERLLLPITKNIVWMSVESAEMTKHAINAFLATSVTFINEIASICELVGADAKEVELGLKSESRIGPKAYLSPGGPYSGGTLARDVQFLLEIGNGSSLATPLISAIQKSNEAHKKWIQRKLLENFPNLSGIRIMVWGLTYKAGTSTLRRSISVDLVNWLIERGAKVQVYDPRVKDIPINWLNMVTYSSNCFEGFSGVNVLVIGSDCHEFQDNAFLLERYITTPNMIIIDPNGYIKKSLNKVSLAYFSVGSKKLYVA